MIEKDRPTRTIAQLKQDLIKAVDAFFSAPPSEVDSCFGLDELDLTDIEIARAEDYREMEQILKHQRGKEPKGEK